MDITKSVPSSGDGSVLSQSVKASVLASKVVNIDGKYVPKRMNPVNSVTKDPTVSGSFASVVNNQEVKKTVKLTVMQSVDTVEGAAVTLPWAAVEEVNARFINTLYGYFIGDRLAFPLVENYVNNAWAKYGLKRIQMHEGFFMFQFNTREGMERVLENGPWLIRLVPLILNEWTPNSILKKDEIKSAPVWVKLHHVPLVAYSEVGLSLITTQIGKPLMLDSYTSNMCINSWGRSSYARVLIEVSADAELLKSLVIAIPLSNGGGHSFATIDIEYEWTPPRCSTCMIFDHTSDKCPKHPAVISTTSDKDAEGFTEVKRKKSRAKQDTKRQVEGVRLTKPSLNLQFRRVDRASTSKPNVKEQGSKVSPAKDAAKQVVDPVISTSNAYNVLDKEDENFWESGADPKQDLTVLNSDSEVDETLVIDDATASKAFVIGEKERASNVNDNPGASTPSLYVSS